MLATCKNDDQLGFILGHEIAHTVLSHGVSTLLSKGTRVRPLLENLLGNYILISRMTITLFAG